MAKEVLGVLCSGRGTDLQSIIDAIADGKAEAHGLRPEGKLGDHRASRIHNALCQLSALGISKAIIVTDNGYWSPENIAEYFVMKYDFITKVQTRLAWVNDEIQKHAADFDVASNCCPFDVTTHAATVVMAQEFPYTRKYGNTRIRNR